MSMNDINRLSHTKWNRKYHIVFFVAKLLHKGYTYFTISKKVFVPTMAGELGENPSESVTVMHGMLSQKTRKDTLASAETGG